MYTGLHYQDTLIERSPESCWLGFLEACVSFIISEPKVYTEGAGSKHVCKCTALSTQHQC